MRQPFAAISRRSAQIGRIVSTCMNDLLGCLFRWQRTSAKQRKRCDQPSGAVVPLMADGGRCWPTAKENSVGKPSAEPKPALHLERWSGGLILIVGLISRGYGAARLWRNNFLLSPVSPQNFAMLGRRNSNFQREGVGNPAFVVVIVARRNPRPMRHLRDHVALDQLSAAAVAPDLAHTALGRPRLRRPDVKAVHVDPLVDDLNGILPSHRWVVVPYHTDIRGHGPRCDDEARTRSPHSRAGAIAGLRHAS